MSSVALEDGKGGGGGGEGEERGTTVAVPEFHVQIVAFSKPRERVWLLCVSSSSSSVV